MDKVKSLPLFTLCVCVWASPLEVCIISISVLVISVGEAGVCFAVRYAAEGLVIAVAALKHLVNRFRRLLFAYLAHGEDGARGPVSHTLLNQERRDGFSGGEQIVPSLPLLG